MVSELAILDIHPGKEAAFEAAFDEATRFISAAPGFERLALRRGVESPNRYVLLVEWRSIEDHDGFRQSPDFQRLKPLLHHFYASFPTVVEHYETVMRVGGPA